MGAEAAITVSRPLRTDLGGEDVVELQVFLGRLGGAVFSTVSSPRRPRVDEVTYSAIKQQTTVTHTQTPFCFFPSARIIKGVLVVLVHLRHLCVGFVFRCLSVGAGKTEDFYKCKSMLF